MTKQGIDDGSSCDIPIAVAIGPLYRLARYDQGHVLAPVRYALVSRYARYVERPSPSHLVLAGRHASPLSWSQNVGRTGPLDPASGHGVALSPLVECGLLGCSCPGGMVGPRSAQHLATAQRWHSLCSQYFGQNLSRLFGDDAIVTKGFISRAEFFQILPIG